MRAPLFSMLLLLVSCASARPTLVTAEPTAVFARFGDRLIRQAEVDDRAGDALKKIELELYELRAQTAEQIALEALVEQAAKKAGGRSTDEWLDEEVSRGLQEPTETEMRALFEKAKERLGPGATFEDVRPRLVNALEQQARGSRARQLFAKLKKEAGFELVAKAPQRPRAHVEPVGPSRGPAQAPVTIVEFADFECPFCARALETVEQVLAAYPEQVRLVFRHFPLSFHAHAQKAAEAAACADEQGLFWKLHDSLFETQALELEELKAQAARLGLDADRFGRCLDSGSTAAVIARDQAAGQKAGVTGTPAFFVNGVLLSGAQPEEAFRKLIDLELGR